MEGCDMCQRMKNRTEALVWKLKLSKILEELWIHVRCSSHWSGSLQNGLRDEQTCGMILASAYVLRCLSAI